MKTSNFVLDACALIAFLNKEPGYEKVRNLMVGAELEEISVYMNSVNLLEVYYDKIKVSGLEAADVFLEAIYDSYIEVLEYENKDILRNAGILKSKYKMSLGDSFALSTAIYKQATIVTSDHHEFDIVEQNENINFLWVR